MFSNTWWIGFLAGRETHPTVVPWLAFKFRPFAHHDHK